ncbi:MAG: TetR/AcrR family transcriptional regulator [Candidatus Methylomirabilales bacterium]
MGNRISAPERRQSIIQAALTLFSQKGFRGTTTREIAREAEVSEATIFKHFATKETLYSAIIDAKARAEEVLAAASQAATARDDAGVLTAVATTILSRVEKDPAFMRLLLYSALEGHALSEMFFTTQVRRTHLFLADYIASRIREGAFRSVDPLLAARGFIGTVIHYLLIHELFGVPRPAHTGSGEVIALYADIFLKGLRP